MPVISPSSIPFLVEASHRPDVGCSWQRQGMNWWSRHDLLVTSYSLQNFEIQMHLCSSSVTALRRVH